MTSPIAVIGGTGLTSLDTLKITHRQTVSTPYGDPSSPLTHGELGGRSVVFLARHGQQHTLPPHKINYRANLWALHRLGVQQVIAVAAVGGIRHDMAPGALAFPDQLVDYTWGRHGTFFEDDLSHVTHIDFTEPYCPALRERLIQDARALELDARESCTYAAMQGPRLETAAEVRKLERDGCDIVGMTGMPEAALARELDLSYVTCAVVANRAAGKAPGEITMAEIQQNLVSGMVRVKMLLARSIPTLSDPL
ncbi:MAG: S-methyl-5'-thioinosine phosphorylase [Candidatus Competibacteraceae bacterium]|nr:S-methyl-5'-thioinosine phosphorylase [Candidatus Competibacteraceae bacterium]MBK7984434.1 S-methyl-5'-thioinosine phosphorylase [Candidatus Competibacteraceae bacterium]MBK8897300.1 S-methyl-5'-thioinosine phosphorylase [Candidatus Competibacteraceae bacterium]MBK8964792.1 S-methyl-5'-thioinosine phosphorylase [Candidatus Competibacteraceae bacterium]MBK9950067.1 S-methyl-5'-thioinosine phosphorylase [Candidatus Competibacteraceae bacterium]